MNKLLALLLLAIPLTAHAEWGKFEYEFDEEKPWAEIEAQLPAYPKEENLLPFFVSAATDNRFFVDVASISTGEDGVVRYTMIVKSSAGASNVSFEGIRCANRERKLYAFGRKEGAWSKARFAKWEPIRYQDRNRQHHMLYDDFFCPNGIIVKNPQEAVDLLKRSFRP
ncbi:MAG: CNP1-like family protein [Gammaproteobacteria bacterium]|nr:CNP1-like family protein [Gammaproteobacteria bacterium]MBU1977613.1 CNP1-like family protein [Gammaproteobacteria bacterium]